MTITFVETRQFSTRIRALGLESELHAVQVSLAQNPERGALDPGTGGLRKLRVQHQARGEGKRGGARVHYLHLPDQRVIYLLFVYAKNERSTLSPVQKKALKQVADAIRAEWREHER